jgi:hypothetical protein
VCISPECRYCDYRDKYEYVINTTTQRCIQGMPASSVAFIPSDGTKLGLEQSTSKITSGSIAAWASAKGQTPRGGSLSFGARIKERKRLRYPKRSISCIQPPANLAVSSVLGGTKAGAQIATWMRNKLVFSRNSSNNRGMAEARPVHQQRLIRCTVLISGRLFAKAKKARSPTS